MNLRTTNAFAIARKKERIILLAILTISLALKLSIWAIVSSSDPSRLLTPDSLLYDNSARTLLQTGAFAVSAETPGVSQTIVPPGYSAFLAGVYAIFGERYSAAIAVQIILSLGTITLVYSIARGLWGGRVALLAALLLALDVASFSHSLMLLTETLFTLLITAMLAAGVRLLRTKGKGKWAFLLGVLLALATLVRPISYYLVAPLALGFFVWGWMQKWQWRTVLTVLTMVVLPFGLLVGGWQLRNYLLTGSAVFSQIIGKDILFYRGAAIVALRDGISVKEAQYQLGMERYSELHPETKNWSAEELSERWTQEGMALIRAHPILFLRSQIAAVMTMMGGPGEGALLRILGVPIGSQGPLGDLIRLTPQDYVRQWIIQSPALFLAFLLAALYLIVVYVGVLHWVWHSVTARQIAGVHLFMWGVLLYFVIISAGPEASFRFRVPITPILTLYAAKGLSQFCTCRTSPGTGTGSVLG